MPMTRNQKNEAAYNQGYESYGDENADNEYARDDERWYYFECGYWDACQFQLEAEGAD